MLSASTFKQDRLKKLFRLTPPPRSDRTLKIVTCSRSTNTGSFPHASANPRRSTIRITHPLRMPSRIFQAPIRPISTSATMPKRVLIIGLLFVLGGVLAIWSIIEAAMHNRISLNFGVFLLPVGIGLLRGRASSQWWARFWIILGYITLVALGCLVFAYPQYAEVKVTWFDTQIQGNRAIPYAFGLLALFVIFLGICHRLLYSPKACQFLSKV